MTFGGGPVIILRLEPAKARGRRGRDIGLVITLQRHLFHDLLELGKLLLLRP